MEGKKKRTKKEKRKKNRKRTDWGYSEQNVKPFPKITARRESQKRLSAGENHTVAMHRLPAGLEGNANMAVARQEKHQGLSVSLSSLP